MAALNDTDNSSSEDLASPRRSHIHFAAEQLQLQQQPLHRRSPHPYSRRRRRADLLSSEFGSSDYSSRWVRSQRTSSDSGTDTDDEGNGILKSLPAPPFADASDNDDDGVCTGRLFRRASRSAGGTRRRAGDNADAQSLYPGRWSGTKWVVELLRRVCETIWLLTVAATALLPDEARYVTGFWRRELWSFVLLTTGLYVLLPIRIYLRRLRWSAFKRIAFFPFSSDFDPAPLIYPIYLPVLVAVSLGKRCHTLILPNIILGLSSLPAYSVPLQYMLNGNSVSHWVVTVIPLIAAEFGFVGEDPARVLSLLDLDPESLVLLFPLHQALVSVLQSLVSTSLLPAEIPLLATGLINAMLFTVSPQGEIFKGVILLGGISIFISCKQVLRWGLVLARIPSWKFRRPSRGKISSQGLWNIIDRRVCQKIYGPFKAGYGSQSDDADGWVISANANVDFHYGLKLDTQFERVPERMSASLKLQNSLSAVDKPNADPIFGSERSRPVGRRRNTFSTADDVKTTPSGRRKRSLPPSLQPFLSLTSVQAEVRKRAYATFVYLAILLIILIPVRLYIKQNALQGQEPFGWAIGYLFGNIPSVRLWLVMSRLDGWACLPSWTSGSTAFCRLGWIEHQRRDTFGEANTRLLICAYCMLVLCVGMALVFRLSAVVEVDTRRKIFHGMMVAMFLPTTFIDPAFTGLAFMLVLAIFLLLEVFRASQLTPVSRPITYFLAPYVDGRDYRGPVVISHIFLLIGCAIPLWLSLAGAQHTGSKPWAGWEIEGRDVSMVSGVICVGMGDAAASLVGRRYGHRRWFWGGDKSIEGSIAFALAVYVGIMVAKMWLVVGGWRADFPLPTTAISAFVAALGSSFTEAVLTGGNDNVVVPLVLWLLVRGLEL
ncbi:dolichol kinase [Ophidiomyces ophidiicola]|nr:dolichol kinase [Ophidiomyces ophidiicola]